MWVQLRGDVNGLKLALDQRADEAATSARVHAISSALFLMANALSTGESIAAPLHALQAVAPDDKVVDAVVQSLLQASKGHAVVMPTVAQLQARWPVVQRSLRTTAALGHEADPGLLSSALAALAARLKVRCTEVAMPCACCICVQRFWQLGLWHLRVCCMYIRITRWHHEASGPKQSTSHLRWTVTGQ
jgi:hypothetical protein